jgi:hypothetical protein
MVPTRVFLDISILSSEGFVVMTGAVKLRCTAGASLLGLDAVFSEEEEEEDGATDDAFPLEADVLAGMRAFFAKEDIVPRLIVLLLSPRLPATSLFHVSTLLCPVYEAASSRPPFGLYTTSTLFPSMSRTAALKNSSPSTRVAGEPCGLPPALRAFV